MKKACILLLIIVSLLACKKEPELKTYVLEITKVEVETGTTTANIRATYSYPAELKSVYLKLSINSDMSASENYLTTIDGNTLYVKLNDLNVFTKYYYCFEYNNGVSQTTTSVLNFITADYSLPIVNTKDVTSITATTAECGGNATDDGESTITSRGVCWGTSHNPTINNSHTNDDQGLGEFISSITGLETNVTYYVRAYATNSKGTSYGEERSFTTQEGLATISTNSVTNITATTAISGGNISDDGGFNITARGVCWSTMQNPTTTNNHTSDGSGLGEFSSSITGLETDVTYYVRAYATNSKGTTYGQELSFTTQDGLAAVTTNSVTNITATSAISGGNITDDGGFSITARGVCWSTAQNPTVNDNHSNDGSGIGGFVSNITGLDNNVSYYVRAYATNSKGTSYGEVRSFTTQEGLAIVTTNPVTEITATSAISGGNISDDGGFSITARGVCWGTSQNPTINDNHTTNGTGIGQFTSNITELSYNTVYYVRAYATNSKGTSYGEEKTFTTSKLAPTVITDEVSVITSNSAICGGIVTSDGGDDVTARGVCYSTSPNPTITNSHTSDGNGTGFYVSNITGLLPSTTYYVKAYATNSMETSYGEQKSFITEIDYPTVTTTVVTNVTTTTALSGGNITSDGGSTITARGVCWSINPNPTINDSHTTDGSGSGSFTSSLTELNEYTTYYVRAYAVNSKGVGYGSQKSFRTMLTTPEGGIPGLFSVSSNQQIVFSQGNLQYQANTNTWKFADNQCDYVGSTNQFISSDYSGWIDLFGWGTSGYNNIYPWSYSIYGSSYPYGNDISNTNYDWGVYNSISNGGNSPGLWRTLTKSEWVYLLVIRPDANEKYSRATINGVHGVVLLPDEFYIPDGLTFIPHSTNWTSNAYSISDWQQMQSSGAVFLPASGKRHGTTVSDLNTIGYYWSSTNNEGSPIDNEYVFYFIVNNLYTNYLVGCTTACAVRLVYNLNP
jgi:hypothetical protein